jgi:phage FluMu gp28-like protein
LGIFRYETKDNPYIPSKWLEKKRLTTPEMIWRQEYQAEFIEGGGVVFRGVDKVVGSSLVGPTPESIYAIGVDLGRHSDFTVITVGNVITNSVVYIERFNREDWAYIEERVREVYNTYNQGTIYIDSTGMGDPIYEDLAKSGMMIYGINMNVSTKPMLIENLQLLIERQNITIPDDQELLLELSAYTYTLSAAGNVKYNAPAGFHDDCVISLALCAFGMSGGAATTIGSFQPSEETEAELFYDEIPNVIDNWDDLTDVEDGRRSESESGKSNKRPDNRISGLPARHPV